MPADSVGERSGMRPRDPVLHLIPMRDARNTLLDDGPIARYFGNMVAGGVDRFLPPRVGGVVRVEG